MPSLNQATVTRNANRIINSLAYPDEEGNRFAVSTVLDQRVEALVRARFPRIRVRLVNLSDGTLEFYEL